MARSETVVYRGRRYHRYPDSRNWRYYMCGKGRRLHRDIWSDAHGKIPAGYCIHHRNGNPLDNRLSNLQLVQRGEHTSGHMRVNLKDLAFRRKRQRAAAHAGLSAPAWHRSLEGRAWHRKLAKHALKRARVKSRMLCEYCGKTYWGRKGTSRFCSISCKVRYRWEHKTGFLKKKCSCGKTFLCDPNMRNRRKYCSRNCKSIPGQLGR
jgi:hypothetical protein